MTVQYAWKRNKKCLHKNHLSVIYTNEQPPSRFSHWNLWLNSNFTRYSDPPSFWSRCFVSCERETQALVMLQVQQQS